MAEKQEAVLLELVALLESFPDWGCIGVIHNLNRAYSALADVYRLHGRHTLAIAYAWKHIWALEEIYQEDGFEDDLIECYQGLSALYEAEGNKEMVAFCEQKTEELSEDVYIFDERGRTHFLGCFGEMTEKCEDILSEKGRMYFHGVADTLMLTASYCEKWDRHKEAEKFRAAASECRRKHRLT